MPNQPKNKQQAAEVKQFIAIQATPEYKALLRPEVSKETRLEFIKEVIAKQSQNQYNGKL